MAIKAYLQAKEIILNHPDRATFAGPRDIHLIIKAEETLGVSFPEPYRQFLQDFGAGNFGWEEIYGVIYADFEHSSVPDAIWYTLTERSEVELPHHLVVIASIGDGDLVCLDVTDGTVICYAPYLSSNEQTGEQIAENFGVYLLAAVKRVLSEA